MANEKLKEESTIDTTPTSNENVETNGEAAVGIVLDADAPDESAPDAGTVDEVAINEVAVDADTELSDDEAVEPEESDELIEAGETIARLEEELATAQTQAAESLDRLQRTAAEFQNSKRRQEKVVADSIARASTHLIRQLLPALDDLDLAFRNTPEGLDKEQAAWADGFSQIQKKLMRTLEEEEVVAMALDGLFDPERHEAVSSEPNDDVESGHIIETLRIGYEHKGRVLRPALVRVAM